MSKAKQKGTTYETQVRTYLNNNEFPNAERQVLHGNKDTGDIKGITSPNGKIILQCKNHQTMQLSNQVMQSDLKVIELQTELKSLKEQLSNKAVPSKIEDVVPDGLKLPSDVVPDCLKLPSDVEE